ncbi:hypothetical protein ACFXI8_13890 [Streptomyces niveus]|uniref:hypothetical protein n=1 Tax=Streptomyces niveus TaxID=193462 RepID=UPI00367E5B76
MSARRNGGGTEYVRVRSLAGEPLKLAHSLEGPVTVQGTPSDGNFDGSGYSYPANELPPVGNFSNGGVTFLFPGSTDGAKNNVTSRGTVIAVPYGRYRRLRLLGACHGGSAGAVAAYTDGTTGTVEISLTDWGRTST